MIYIHKSDGKIIFDHWRIHRETNTHDDVTIIIFVPTGHSLGEMACAYHDDTFTAEELILSTYSRGKACLETDLIKGSMAAVGIGYTAVRNPFVYKG